MNETRRIRYAAGTALAAALLALCTLDVRAQAETGSEPVDAVLYVDQQHPQASDANPGTEALPLRTISKAVSLAGWNVARGVGTRIVVGPGTYRESVEIRGRPRRNRAPLVLEAAVPGETIVSGSDVFEDWTHHEGGIFSHAWTAGWGVAPNPWAEHGIDVSALARRREIVFVDGVLLRQYLSYRELQANPGSFYVDTQAGRLYVHAPGGNLDGHTVEVAVRPSALQVVNAQYVTLRGFVFEHAASRLPNGAVYVGDAAHVLIEDCTFRWNNWAGLKLYQTDYVTVRRSAASFNGAMGIGGTRLRHFLFEDVETNHNNEWRGGAWGGFYEPWATAGSKFLHVHDGVFRRYETSRNEIVGFWLDANNQRVTVERLVSCENRETGLFLEISQGPIVVRESLICFNGGRGGIHIANSRQITLERNVVYGNRHAQLYSPARDASNRERCFTDWVSGARICQRSGAWTLQGNTFVATESGQALIDVPYAAPPRQAVDDISSDGNRWYHPGGGAAFLDRSRAPKTFDAWKARWGADDRSVLLVPSFTEPLRLDFPVAPGSAFEKWRLLVEGHFSPHLFFRSEKPAPRMYGVWQSDRGSFHFRAQTGSGNGMPSSTEVSQCSTRQRNDRGDDGACYANSGTGSGICPCREGTLAALARGQGVPVHPTPAAEHPGRLRE